MRQVLGVLVLALAAGTAAGTEVTVKLTPVEMDKVPFVVPLVAPGPTCVAADGLATAAVGQKVGKEAQVSLFRLEGQGLPTGAPVVLKLPRPASVAAREVYPLSLVLH